MTECSSFLRLCCVLKVLNGKKGAGGICVAKSSKAIVIGMYNADSGIQVRMCLCCCLFVFLSMRLTFALHQAGPCSAAVQAMAADLKKKGF